MGKVNSLVPEQVPCSFVVLRNLSRLSGSSDGVDLWGWVQSTFVSSLQQRTWASAAGVRVSGSSAREKGIVRHLPLEPGSCAAMIRLSHDPTPAAQCGGSAQAEPQVHLGSCMTFQPSESCLQTQGDPRRPQVTPNRADSVFAEGTEKDSTFGFTRLGSSQASALPRKGLGTRSGVSRASLCASNACCTHHCACKELPKKPCQATPFPPCIKVGGARCP